MLSSLGCLLLCGSIALALGNAQKLPKGKRPNLKVHINTTSDSILLKFLRPNPNVKLEGFLLGYGSNVSPNQYFPLPTEGKVTEAVVDAEPKYLIVVRPAPPPSQKKSCSGKSRSRKPLQLVVGTLSPSSVFLSWGFLINPHHDWTLPSHCPNDRFYTIRYREKDKEKKWIFQLCPATETIVDNLKPNTVYEFGVKDNMDGGIWSKVFNHKTVVGSKNKVNGKIQSTYDQVHTVPAYVPRKLIPITIIKQVIQNVTHRASTKAPDKTPFGGTILVHLIIPGLNDSMVKLPTSIMLEISDALKAQLAKNETLALPAESKTPEVEKVASQPVTVTPETVSRSIKSTVSSALDTSEPALALNEKTPETAHSVLMPEFELPLSTLAPKRFPEFPEAEAAFPLEKPGGTLVSSEDQWVAPGVKTSGDSKFVQPPTATHDVISSSTTSDETEIEPHTATSDPILDSVPPKTSRTPEQPRATLAPSEASFDPHKVEIFTSPEVQPTTAAPQQTTSIPTTSKRRFRPKPPPIIKPAPTKTKRPGRLRPRPKTTRSPEVPESKPAREPATVPLVPTTVPKLSQRPKATRRPEVPQIQPDLKPPKQLPPKPKATPDMPPTKFAYEQPATLGTEAPALAIVTTTDIEPVITRTKAPATALAPKTPQPRTHRPRPPIHKATPRPEIPQPKPAELGPITPEPSLASTTTKKARRRLRPKDKTIPHPEVPQTILVPATTLEPVIRTEAPGMTLAPKLPQQPSHPHPKPKTTRSPTAPQTERVSTPVFEPVTPLKEDPVATIVPITDLEPVTDLETPVAFRTEVPGTTLASKMSQRTRRPKPRPTATMSPQAPQTKPALEPVTPRPEAPVTLELEPVTLRTETWVTTKAPKTTKRPRRPRLKPKTTPAPKAPLTKPVAATDLEPSALRTEAPATVVLATALEPVTLRTKAPETTTLASKVHRTQRPHPRPKTTASTDMSESKSAPTELQTLVLKPVTSPSLEMTHSQSVSDDRELVAFSTESPQKTIAPAETDYVDTTIKEPLRPEEPRTEVVDSLTHVSGLPETMLETSPLPSQTIVLPRPEEPQMEPVPRQTPGTPPKLKTTPRPRIPPQPPVPKGSQRTTSKPKTPPRPEGADTTSVPKDEQLSHKTDPEVSHTETVLPPVTFRAEPLKTTIAPLETRNIPFIPVISPRPSQEELQTALEETDRSTQELFTTKIPQTTEWAKTTQAPHRLHTTPVRPRILDRPHARPVLNKTTTRPGKTKPKGNGIGTGTKQAPKPPSTGRNVSVDPHATKKPATTPGTRRPPMRPGPISPQRKPLPPNNVTGKPGSAGIISSSRVTSPPLKATLKPTGTAAERPEAEKKHPTTPASEEEIGNPTDFSSSPTKETDHLGKPRFTGPHVRYIPKPDNRPCSITDSVRRFPTEEAIEGNATSPPQNPPTNLTVVTVEGCPSFVILDWEKPLNDTVTEYEVISRENGSFSGKNKSIQITNQTFSTVENLKPDTSYEFQVKPKNPLGEGPASNTVAFSTESADPRVSEPISAGRDAIWTERPFNSDSYSECKGKQYVKRTWYKKFVGVQLCNSLRYKIYLSDSLTGKFYNIGDQRGHGEDHCQFVDSFLDGRTGQQLASDQLPTKEGYFRAVRQEPVQFGEIGGHTQINYVQWYECGTTIPGKW
ncbi:target of Nesh-SH3 isoform X5 [Peromyscus maniculatus bairdii]|uniref:target of Nesh-SH3 isoform X5 n=1 Tax=Peromyscus maniculatus bairdii TaxID=230844 RepID=UPI003FD28630